MDKVIVIGKIDLLKPLYPSDRDVNRLYKNLKRFEPIEINCELPSKKMVAEMYLNIVGDLIVRYRYDKSWQENTFNSLSQEDRNKLYNYLQ